MYLIFYHSVLRINCFKFYIGNLSLFELLLNYHYKCHLHHHFKYFKIIENFFKAIVVITVSTFTSPSLPSQGSVFSMVAILESLRGTGLPLP